MVIRWYIFCTGLQLLIQNLFCSIFLQMFFCVLTLCIFFNAPQLHIACEFFEAFAKELKEDPGYTIDGKIPFTPKDGRICKEYYLRYLDLYHVNLAYHK